MDKNLVMMALKEIPRISKNLNNGNDDAKSEMRLIIAALENAQPEQGMAMAMASTSFLLKAVEGRPISEDMAQTIKKSALKELACKFNCEADFKDENKIQMLKGLLK
ncbi:hypothetical protein [Sulfurimonas sp. NWX367]|uniref:hypothetical protein n=1 Tax=Sulfurimonas sp. NWX367 TaxID=2925413 RepID=UPI0032046EF8